MNRHQSLYFFVCVAVVLAGSQALAQFSPGGGINTPDPNIKRPYQWVWDIGVQHEVVKGLAVTVSYNQRSFYNLTYTTSLAIPFSQYTLATVADPRDATQTLPVYNVNRAVFGQVNDLDTTSLNNTRVFKGVDVSFNMRIPGGGSLNGGTSTGRSIFSTCDVSDPNSTRFCDQNQYNIPMLTQFKLSGTYPLVYGIRLSGSFQSSPGTERSITYQVTRTQLPTLVQASVSVRLNEPGTLYNERVNQSISGCRNRSGPVAPSSGLRSTCSTC